MHEATHRIVTFARAFLWTALIGLFTGGLAWTHDAKPSDVVVSESLKPKLHESPISTTPARKPLDLLLTQAELREFIRHYEIRTGEDLTAPIDEEEVVVTAPAELAPMRDVSQDVWGGVAAPFWAIMNPKDAWRIFVPIPPKGRPREEEATPRD